MIYPAQTSFIPVQVALARFLAHQGWQAIFAKYPYWYLGTTPFRYLSGPILPGMVVILHKILPKLSFFDLLFFLILVGFLLGAFGVYLLLKTLGATKKIAFVSTSFYIFGLLLPFLFRFSDGLSLIAFSFLPFVLFWYFKFLTKPTQKRAVLLIFGIAFALLINSQITTPMLLGMLAIFLTTSGWKRAERKTKQTLGLVAIAFLLTTIWYTPGFWWQILIAPSFAGKPLFRVIGELAQLLPIALAVGLAIVSGKIIKSKDRLIRFCFYWLFIFGFLSLIRFLSDPDFWLDWLAYAKELQLGGAIAIGLIIRKIKRKYLLLPIFICYFFLFTFVFKHYVLGALQVNIKQTVEYQVGQKLAKILKPGEKVFLSGSTVFWLNAFFDINQVRGGNDRPSVDHQWRKAVWEIREGQQIEESIKYLRMLNIAYIVVHTSGSKEFYHDFTYPEKFEEVEELKKVYEQAGDRIYQVNLSEKEEE